MNLSVSNRSARFINAARLHADTVLAQARDRWGAYCTPLLADGLHIESYAPVTWLQHGRSWILSNPASQQNFMRVLIGLSRLGAGPDYAAAAREVTQYVLRHLRCGDMLWWGAHCSADLMLKRLVFCTDGSAYPRHELERCFPFYELMYAVDAHATQRVIEGTWQMHMRDWSVLSFNRHNIVNLPPRETTLGPEQHSIWDHEYIGGDFTSEYFTFMPAGIDLAYAAALLSSFNGDKRPLLWARRLVDRSMQAEHSDTGLPMYFYNASFRSRRADGHAERPDRAMSQLGPQLGRTIAEGSVWMPSQVRDVLYCCINLLELSTAVAEPAFSASALQTLLAFAAHVFDHADGLFHPTLTDGTRLTGLVLERDGYFGNCGTTLSAKAADAPALLAFACGYRYAQLPQLWQVCRTLVARLKLGELGAPGGANFEPNLRYASGEPMVLLALLALHQATGRAAFMQLAERMGDNIVAKRLHAGLFAAPGKHYARIDALEPLALLHLAQVIDAGHDQVPVWFGGRGRFHALYDGHGRTTDSALFYD